MPDHQCDASLGRPAFNGFWNSDVIATSWSLGPCVLKVVSHFQGSRILRRCRRSSLRQTTGPRTTREDCPGTSGAVLDGFFRRGSDGMCLSSRGSGRQAISAVLFFQLPADWLLTTGVRVLLSGAVKVCSAA